MEEPKKLKDTPTKRVKKPEMSQPQIREILPILLKR